MTTQLLRETGLEVLGHMPWGTHCCHFFNSQNDLLHTLIPFFRAGLAAGEFCLWVADVPLTAKTAVRVLRQGIPDSDRYLADGSIEIVSARDWYLKGGKFSMARILGAWEEKLAHASSRGYAGMRANGNVGWLQKKNDWKRFDEYEHALDESLNSKAMIVLCSYDLEKCGAADVLNVARTHQYAIAKRAGDWEVLEWRPPLGPEDSYRTLTMRERQVLLLAAEGLTSPQIAKNLAISVRTAESHRASFMRKLGLRHQTDVVRYALRRGLPALLTQRH